VAGPAAAPAVFGVEPAHVCLRVSTRSADEADFGTLAADDLEQIVVQERVFAEPKINVIARMAPMTGI